MDRREGEETNKENYIIRNFSICRVILHNLLLMDIIYELESSALEWNPMACSYEAGD